MFTKQELQPNLTTSLKLTPALKQSLEILQLSNLELDEYILKNVTDNPLLKFEPSEVISEASSNYLSINSHFRTTKNSRNHNITEYDYINNLSVEQNLKEYLRSQLPILKLRSKHKLIAEYLIDSVDDDGYLKTDITVLVSQLKTKTSRLKDLIAKLQTLEPIGVFANNLQECLSLQLKYLEQYDEVFEQLLSKLELVARGELEKLTKYLNITKEELIKRIKIIKSLEPKPGRNFIKTEVDFKLPELTLHISQNGEFIIEFNDAKTASIAVDNYYYEQLKQKLITPQDKSYTIEKLRSANNFVRAIEQRKKTIMKVAAALVHEQQDFFKRGILYLKPLTLSNIAQLTGFNESTISRTVNSKYIATALGIFELKYFFSSKVADKYEAGEVASTKVKELIKSLINNEDPNSPHTDQMLVKELQHFNIAIARRTVAKYRETIGLPTSTERARNYKTSKQFEEA